MLPYLIQGFLLGLAWDAPIGAQNLYVINTALRAADSGGPWSSHGPGTDARVRALATAWTTVALDISLALACFNGVGALIERSPLARHAFLLFGSAALFIIGIRLLRAPAALSTSEGSQRSYWQIVAACLAGTWGNPQALVDGSLLLGGVRATLPAGAAPWFLLGVCLASFAWFTTLATVTLTARRRFRPALLRAINVACGAVILFYGARLALAFFARPG